MASDTVHPAPCFGRHMYVLRGVVDAVNEIKLTFSDADIGALEERFVGLEVEKPPAMQILDDVLDSMFPLMTPALAAIVRSTWGVSPTTNWHHTYTAALRFMHNTAETMLLETCEERIHLLVHSGIGFELERFHARVGGDGLRRTQVISFSLFFLPIITISQTPILKQLNPSGMGFPIRVDPSIVHPQAHLLAHQPRHISGNPHPGPSPHRRDEEGVRPHPGHAGHRQDRHPRRRHGRGWESGGGCYCGWVGWRG